MKNKKKLNDKPFWETGLNPITMFPPLKENYKDNETKRYYVEDQPGGR